VRAVYAEGKWLAAAAAFLLPLAACAPPNQGQNVASVQSPTPSPSPTPTTPFATSGPGFHVGEVGINYTSVSFTADGGVKPYHWTVTAGVLPPGLSLSDDGTVSGEPTTAGKYGFTIQAADSGDSKATIPGVIDVAPPLNASLLPACAKYCVVELGCVNVCGSFGALSGGVAPYTYKVTAGQLPAGTKLSTLSLTGTFAGLTGYLQFSVQVTDALGATSTVSPTFWMYPHISLRGGTCQSTRLTPGKCTVALAYSGGTPGQQVTLAPTSWTGDLKCGSVAAIPCPQPSFAVSYGPGQATVTLTYQANYPFTFGTLAVRLTSSDPCGAGASCGADASITVAG
jgi:hypothetical protein